MAVNAGSAVNEKVLLVDDESSIRESLGRVLRSEGYEVTAASNGQEALKILSETVVQLVLLDINMPVVNGWDAFEQMMEINPFLPVIVITARPDQREPAGRAGVAAMLEKPLAVPGLLETMRQVLAETVEARRQRLAGRQMVNGPSLMKL
jgi:CheY-like chemotaxis protein